MNTKELVAKAIEMNLWVPTGAKTPEQTLYSAIFREIKTSETPRIIRAEKKGKFQIT
ncbi:MAG: HTH domain-containing protein [Lentisphaeria bacterium]|nr:HTH domain-containing protein [Lentisphaeria bacterium]